MEKFLDRIVSPDKRSLMSLLIHQRSNLEHFEQFFFNLVTFDNLKLKCVLFEHKRRGKSSSFQMKNTGFFKAIRKMVDPENYEAGEKESEINRKMDSTLLIYNHSHGSSRYEGCHLLSKCADEGMSLLLYDSRGCGESDGDYITFGKEEKIDLLFLLLKVQLEYKFTSFLLWGRSIGCNAVISFLYEMESNTSEYLNALLMEKQKASQSGFRGLGRTTPSKSRRRPQYPKENFNRFFNKVILKFLEQNDYQDKRDHKFNITVIGMVLDSVYRSLKALINDNIERALKGSILATLSKKPANAMMYNYLMKKISYDMTKNQNKHLLPKIGCSCMFIISDQDEMIPLRRFKKTIAEYKPKGVKTGNFASINTKKKHGSGREDKLIEAVFKFVKNKFEKKYFFEYNLQFNQAYDQISNKNKMKRRGTGDSKNSSLVYDKSKFSI